MLLVGYLAVAYAMRDLRGERYRDSGHEFMLNQLFNGATFASSITILWGVMDPKVMAIISDTTSFLLLAGLAGALYSIRQLIRSRVRR